MKIEHGLKMVSFTNYDENNNLTIYWVSIENAKPQLHSIEKFVRNSKNGKTYAKKYVYHFEYKKGLYNFETDEFEQPQIPSDIETHINNYLKGFIVNAINNANL